MTAVRLPSVAIVQAANLPAVPPPSTRTSYFSGAFMGFISSERFEIRQTKQRLGSFTVNNHGVILAQVRGSRQIVILIAWIVFQRTKVQAMTDAIALTLASPKQDTSIWSIRGCEIAQAKIFFAARLLIDGCAPARLLRFGFESSCKNWLGIGARIKWRGLVHFLIDPEFLGPEGPPQSNENRKANRNEYPFPPAHQNFSSGAAPKFALNRSQ